MTAYRWTRNRSNTNLLRHSSHSSTENHESDVCHEEVLDDHLHRDRAKKRHGDHPENDIQAPMSIGMRAIWMNRKGDEWPEDALPPDAEVRCLEGLVAELGI